MEAVHHPNCRCTIRPVVPEITLKGADKIVNK
jgi:hypothetical protein